MKNSLCQIYPDHIILHNVVLSRLIGLQHHKCWRDDAFDGRQPVYFL